ncbi:MAG TPA: hypothetical protein VII49_05215 [Rhizomicrobium sp.]
MRLSCKWARYPLFVLLTIYISSPANAQVVAGDTFSDGKDGAKVHVASGFVCPAKIGLFERDAVGESDPSAGADFCAYSTQDGVYGTIKLTPVTANYDPKLSLVRDFTEQEATGGKKISEADTDQSAKGAAPIAIYTRSYETSKLEDLHYRVLFAGANVKGWAVEAVIEYADPRDTSLEQEFLHAVYAAAPGEIGAK